MIFADFRQDCFNKLDASGLGSKSGYARRLEDEMNLIKTQYDDYKTDVVEYFLNMVEHTKTNGKIANSNNMLTSYILGITDEDPLKKEKALIKTKSAEFPDIDMDFEDSKRDLVKEYVVEKYGRENVASIAAFGKMQAKNVIKDIARVKGIPHEEVNEVTKTMDIKDTVEKAYNSKDNVRAFFDKYQHMDLLKLCMKLQGNVRHLSQHAAGVVIAPSNITNFCGLEKAKDNIITCFEEAGGSKELSKLGLVKMDFLGLNTLTVIHEALDNIKKNHGKEIDIENIDFYDPEVMKEFASANTVGIFQFERDWVRMMLSRMKITEFKDIAALNALNRPGPQSMGENLWKTKQGLMPYAYLHSSLESILKATYCVIIYQEQVTEIAQKLAGFSDDEADNFRKAMSSGKSDLQKGFNPFEQYEQRFIDGCRKNGIKERINVTRTISGDKDTSLTAQDVKLIEEITEKDGTKGRKISCNVEVSDEIFHQIKQFAGYGFNKSHAVEYSQVAFMAMYLKHYYPIEFMASLLSNTPNAVNQVEHTNKFVDYFFEAKRMKIKVEPPSVNRSNERFTPTKDGIISGFGFIKELGDRAVKEIIEKRPFKNFNEFIMKTSSKSVNKSAMFSLIYSGCFDDFLPIGNDKQNLTLRYGLLEQYVAMRKIKDANLTKSPLPVDAILAEADVCGDQMFNSLLDIIPLDKVNEKYGVDDKMKSFSSVEKINVGTTIRVFGVVQSWFVKRNPAENKGIGFLVVKNGSRTHRFIAWNSEINKITDKIDKILKPKNVITFRIKRERDYKDQKSFMLQVDGMEKLL